MMEPAGAPAPEPFPPTGSTVTVEGLKSQPEHNGCDAVVLRHVEKTGRCQVKLLGCGRVLAVRPANLRPRAALALATAVADDAPAGELAALLAPFASGLDGAGATTLLLDALGCEPFPAARLLRRAVCYCWPGRR
jgi:hypothetical protein